MRPTPSLPDVEAAATRIAGLIAPTPLVASPWLSELTGATVWLKLEIVQHTGSYKLRGAANALIQRRAQPWARPTVITASAGNHGQAVAYVARELGMRARVHLPATAPEAKRRSLERFGADIVPSPTYDDAEAAAHAEAARTGTPYLSPYNDADVIAGAGTVALEMLRQRPNLDTFIVPLGGGGLLSGTAVATRALAPKARIVGVEAEASPVFTAALKAGRPVLVDVHPTLADGLAGNMDLDTQTFPIVRDLVDEVRSMSEARIARAMRDLLREERLVAEGAGAMGVAAAMAGSLDLRGRVVGIIISGRNVDAATIDSVLAS
jgi:threonine dehydratase